METPLIRWRAYEVMNPKVLVTTRHARGRDLAFQLLSGGSTGVPVVELSGEVVGIVTEFDLLKAIQDGKNLEEIVAEQIMTECPICVDEYAFGDEVVRKMIEHRIIRIPVVREHKLIGMISRADILSHVLNPELVCFVS